MGLEYPLTTDEIIEHLLGDKGAQSLNTMSGNELLHHFMRYVASRYDAPITLEIFHREWTTYSKTLPEATLKRLQAEINDPVNLSLLNDAQRLDYIINDAEIVRSFFVALRAQEEVTKDADTIAQLWKSYVSKLPSSLQPRAKKLTSIATYTSKELPKRYRFHEAIKAMFLISVPDRLYLKNLNGLVLRGGRDDMMMGKIQYTSSLYNGRVTLTPDAAVNQQTFEDKIIQQSLIEKPAQFEAFMPYVQTGVAYDKYTIAACAKLFIDTFKKDFNLLFNDAEIKRALQASEMAPAKIIEILVQRYAYYVEAYVLAKVSNNDQIKRDFHEAIINTLMSVGCNFEQSCDPNWDANTFINEYVKFYENDLRLLVSPALSEADRARQKQVYSKAAMIRESERVDQLDLIKSTQAFSPDLSTKDILPNDLSIQITEPLLALTQSFSHNTEDSYSLLAEDSNYSINTAAQNFQAEDNEEKTIDAFFRSNLAFIRQINFTKVEFISGSLLKNLWDQFVLRLPTPQQTALAHLRDKINEHHASLISLLQEEREKDANFKNRATQEQQPQSSSIETSEEKQIQAAAILWAYPSIFEKLTLSQEKQSTFFSLMAEDNITRLRIASEWIANENLENTILNYFSEYFDEIDKTLLSIDATRTLRILLSFYANIELRDLNKNPVALISLRNKLPQKLFVTLFTNYWAEHPLEAVIQAQTKALLENDASTLYAILTCLYTHYANHYDTIRIVTRAITQSADKSKIKIYCSWLMKQEKSEKNAASRYAYLFSIAVSILDAAHLSDFNQMDMLLSNLSEGSIATTSTNHYEQDLITAFNLRAEGSNTPLPHYFDAQRIKSYLLNDLTKLPDFDAKSRILALLKSELPTHESIMLASSLAQGLLARECASRWGYLSSKARQFCRGLEKFSLVTSEEHLSEAFNQYLVETQAIKYENTNVEAEIQRYTLRRRDEQQFNNTLKLDHQNLTPLPADGQQALKALRELKNTTPQREKTSHYQKKAGSAEKNNSLYEESFKRWLEYFKTHKDRIDLSEFIQLTKLQINETTIKNCYSALLSVLTPVSANATGSELYAQRGFEGNDAIKSADIEAFFEILRISSIKNLRNGKHFWTVLTSSPENLSENSTAMDNSKNINALMHDYLNSDMDEVEKAKLALEIERECTEDQLAKLRAALDSYKDEAIHFFSKNPAPPRGMQAVITTIDEGKPTIEILASLKKQASERGKDNYHLTRNKKTTEAYDLINHFFDENSNMKMDQLIEGLETTHNAKNNQITNKP